jgi:Holliday junction DNA helicase RuvA
MIAHLTGFVSARSDASCVVDVNGVGYLVLAPTRTLAALPAAPPGVATVFTERQVREDAIALFGFASGEEREWFRLLTTVHRVGWAGGVECAVDPVAGGIGGGDRGAARSPR